jgi:hypothetical protein
MQGKGIEFDWKFAGQISMFGLISMTVLITLVYACGEPKPQKPSKYKQGDVVWLKPDSTRAVVSHVWVSDLQYIVDYYDADHKAQDMVVPEFGIYSKVN